MGMVEWQGTFKGMPSKPMIKEKLLVGPNGN